MEDSSLPKKTTLFKESKGVTYRIPALLYIESTSTFLAFAEKRKSRKDEEAEYLVMKRGLYKEDAVEWEESQILKEAFQEGFRAMNPCPIYDEKSKVLFLFFNCLKGHEPEQDLIKSGKNPAQMWYIKSTDDGKTWIQGENLTQVVAHAFPNLTTSSVGPGHGIQMEKGELVLPGYTYDCTGKVQSFYLFRKDEGQTWQASKGIDKFQTLECEVAEIKVKDGKSKLYCNARATAGKRVEALCDEIGGEFKSVTASEKLNETGGGCEGSTLSFLGTNNISWLLFSHPSNKNERKDLGIYLNKSPEQSKSWSNPWIIYKGPSAYSDLAHCKDTDTFAILFECGETDSRERIDFCLFTLQNVLDNTGKKMLTL